MERPERDYKSKRRGIEGHNLNDNWAVASRKLLRSLANWQAPVLIYSLCLPDPEINSFLVVPVLGAGWCRWRMPRYRNVNFWNFSFSKILYFAIFSCEKMFSFRCKNFYAIFFFGKIEYSDNMYKTQECSFEINFQSEECIRSAFESFSILRSFLIAKIFYTRSSLLPLPPLEKTSILRSFYNVLLKF